MFIRLATASLVSLGLFALPLAGQETPRPVKLVTAEKTQPGLTRQFFGRVVAKQTVDLAFQVGGQITRFSLIEGQPVVAGGLIAQLDLVPFELAHEQARIQKDQADRTLERLSRLGGNVSQVSVQDAETQAALAAVALQSSADSLAKATLVAPFDALVAARNVANFTTISPGVPVVRLHDMSELQIEIDVPEILFQRAGEDPDVSIVAKFPSSDTVYPLEVREFNAEATRTGQTFRLTFALPKVNDLNVLPGSSVTVSATLNEGEARIQVAAAALGTDPDGSVYVMVFTAQADDTGVLKRADVQIEATPDGRLTIVSGLEGGEEIVAAGVNVLNDGQTVRRFTGFAN